MFMVRGLRQLLHQLLTPGQPPTVAMAIGPKEATLKRSHTLRRSHTKRTPGQRDIISTPTTPWDRYQKASRRCRISTWKPGAAAAVARKGAVAARKIAHASAQRSRAASLPSGLHLYLHAGCWRLRKMSLQIICPRLAILPPSPVSLATSLLGRVSPTSSRPRPRRPRCRRLRHPRQHPRHHPRRSP